jgi:hypothetical protein
VGLNSSGYFSDTVNQALVSGSITVGTTAVAARVGASNLSERQILRIYNGSNGVIYLGDSSVTTESGEPLERKQWITYPLGDQLDVYLISNANRTGIIVQEMA